LAKLGDQHAGAPALLAGERLDLPLHPEKVLVAFVLPAIDARHRADLCAMPG
jgi:hypothetical protein